MPLALPRHDWVLVVAGALLLALAYPPFHLFLPSFLCLVPAVWLIERGSGDSRPLRRHLVQGWWLGLAANALVLYWMIVALWHFTPLSALGYAATIAVLALWSSVLFALTGWVRRTTQAPLLVVFPVFWTAVEWAIGHQGDVRFPWLGLGTSLTHYPTIVQIADVVGARGITLLLAAANTALALAWIHHHHRARVLRLVGAVLLGLGAAAAYGVVRERGLTIRSLGRAAVIQPNIGYDEKWEPAHQDSIVNRTLALAAQAGDRTRPDLLVWPEAAIPSALQRHPAWEARLAAEARALRTPMVVGGIDLVLRSPRDYDYYNAAFVFERDGRLSDEPPYRKHYLVPIVERVPFLNPRWFQSLKWFGGFGVGAPGPVYRIGIGGFGILICYESAFEDLSRRYRRDGADFLVNITNDAWFGNTSAPYQHAAHLVMRAIENRVGIVRAANSGISEFVDPLGRESQRTRLGARTFEAGPVFTTDVHTVYTALGDWVGLLAVVTSLVLCVGAWWRTS